MMFPIRCFTCGNLIGDKWEEYELRLKEGDSPAKILDELRIERYCCRRMFISHVELIDELLKNIEISVERQKKMMSP